MDDELPLPPKVKPLKPEMRALPSCAGDVICRQSLRGSDQQAGMHYQLPAHMVGAPVASRTLDLLADINYEKSFVWENLCLTLA